MIDVDEALARETLTVSQAAYLLGCSTESIRRYMARGLLVGWRLPWSGQRRILAASVLDIRNSGPRLQREPRIEATHLNDETSSLQAPLVSKGATGNDTTRHSTRSA